ncbi:excinuclease ABC subunit UvrC [Sansalvadorimonas sp. 2012CJ34-2]|uniref:UvrABC system protein C n=1 Tax=Parendozoicomonas callyspongiae TaxID=2942213 RepID=A0ABT0PET0_9GAMM|nr:excinuclease ABC subunit UvrC [Sansalvadorimonas sp. 2012CJ34-2]MCL6269874.1 excinuclease ABC subunit UvrC [Sansalvadorimonas sp. 2012CJ34-2]
MSSSSDSTFNHKAFISSVTDLPGVYRMLGLDGKILYIGKAKCLKKRLASYFRPQGRSSKTTAMVAKIHSIETIVTNSEAEALILEQNLIKDNRPPYNILLRDDKSYPFIFLSEKDKWPRLALHRGVKRRKGKYFGPYPSAGAARESLALLQKVFRVRQCEDSFFRNRTRPCLQYQINRCKGPCVDLVAEDEYSQDVKDSIDFLQGRSQELIYDLIKRMEAASEKLEFEAAADYRDSIDHLRKTQEKQVIAVASGDADVFGFAQAPGGSCVQVIFVRQGRVLGSRHFFPGFAHDGDKAEALESFLGQFYISNADTRDFPRDILLPMAIPGHEALTEAVQTVAGRTVQLRHNVRGERKDWLKLAERNAVQTLNAHLADRRNIYERFLSLQKSLDLPDIPERIECFDISHTMGEGTVASCVVFGQEGARKSDYRRFNIRDITPGDDYAAIAQAVQRRYCRVLEEEGVLPDILLIDGGLGQLNKAKAVMDNLQLGHVAIYGVAKGETRKPGLEVLIEGQTGKEFTIESSSPGLHLIQQVRDESHRFAITGHRQRRDKKRRRSQLEDIEGIGPKRRAALLSFFGSVKGVKEAPIEELMKVQGISRSMAQHIHDVLK